MAAMKKVAQAARLPTASSGAATILSPWISPPAGHGDRIVAAPPQAGSMRYL